MSPWEAGSPGALGGRSPTQAEGAATQGLSPVAWGEGLCPPAASVLAATPQGSPCTCSEVPPVWMGTFVLCPLGFLPPHTTDEHLCPHGCCEGSFCVGSARLCEITAQR